MQSYTYSDLSGFSPLTTSAFVMKSGTHQAKAPTENVTQVKPKVTHINEGLK